ncbi:peptidoglycan-binding protein [Frankia sp. AgB32]|uniref:peptidoglycan-binding domain-containing protein n=1 Tax=Frankia sp. AgB32 TaxID=631119 RepID=UPI00200E9844|nr:peptidoglycan-binding domain-containing protein [Frankia sp. AgB32]MCK9895737.1 peptidoglycan-binding protein [Frankia sp. AgB32]
MTTGPFSLDPRVADATARPPSPRRARGRSRPRLQLVRAFAAMLTAVAMLLTAGCIDLNGLGGGGRIATLTSCQAMSRRADNDHACVVATQNALFILGESVKIDGTYGPGTEVAIRRFQKGHGLPADGIAGSRTLTALQSRIPGSRTIITNTGVITCRVGLRTCTYVFTRTVTRQIYQATGPAQNLTVLCPRMLDIRGQVACEVLVTIAVLVVRRQASTALRENGCLAVEPAAVTIRPDVGRYCRP